MAELGKSRGRSQEVVRLVLDKPGVVLGALLLVTLLCSALLLRSSGEIALESMLPASAPARIAHENGQRDFALLDRVVLGVINDKHPDGVLNPDTLHKVHALDLFVAGLAEERQADQPVLSADRITPDSVEFLEQDGLGKIRFEWVMAEPPASREGALAVRDRALASPLLQHGLLSGDGKALALSYPVADARCAMALAQALREKIVQLDAGDERYYIGGQPVLLADYAMKAPLQTLLAASMSALVLFLCLLVLFRRLSFALAPMAVVLAAMSSATGILAGTGQPLPAVGVLLPLCVLPFAVAGSFAVLCALRAAKRSGAGHRAALEQTMVELFVPSLWAALMAAGVFAALLLVPLTPIRIFGIAAAGGIIIAWLWNNLGIPACFMLVRGPEILRKKSGLLVESKEENCAFFVFIERASKLAVEKPWPVLGLSLLLLGIGCGGTILLEVNDNPLHWFKKSSELRIADTVLQDRFGRSGGAHLLLFGQGSELNNFAAASQLRAVLAKRLGGNPEVAGTVDRQISVVAERTSTGTQLADELGVLWGKELAKLPASDARGYASWSMALDALDALRNREQIFKRPDVIEYLLALQSFLDSRELVVRSSSMAGVVRQVHRELFEGDPGQYKVPDTVNGVAQTLVVLQKSHKPDALWHFVGRDYSRAALHLQLRSGDKQDLEAFFAAVDSYLAAHPAPVSLEHSWAGSAPLAVAWQNKLACGVVLALPVALGAVFLCAMLWCRSPLLALAALAPPLVTTLFAAGLCGLTGKPFDVSMAVLLFLGLGISAVFALQILQEARMGMASTGDWQQTLAGMLRAPACHIGSTSLILLFSGLPLFWLPLAPFQRYAVVAPLAVLLAGFTALALLPVLLTIWEGRIFQRERAMAAATGQEKDAKTPTPGPAPETGQEAAVEQQPGEPSVSSPEPPPQEKEKNDAPSLFDDMGG